LIVFLIYLLTYLLIECWYVAESVVHSALRFDSVDGVDQPADVDTNITSPTPVVQPLPAAAVSPSRKHSETLSPSAAVYKLGEWTERTTSPTVQLVGFSRINSQRRGAMDKVLSYKLLLYTASRTCVVTRTHSTFGDRAFRAAGPGLWNSLPSHLKDADLSYSKFRRSLKTFLFEQWGYGTV